MSEHIEYIKYGFIFQNGVRVGKENHDIETTFEFKPKLNVTYFRSKFKQ